MDIQTVRQFIQDVNVPDLLVCIFGVAVFGVWLLSTSLGRKGLIDSPPRRNNMHPVMPLIPLLVWAGATLLADWARHHLLGGLQGWQGVLADNIVLCVGLIAATIAALWLARASFARRLKGFGLDVRTAPRDFWGAFLNLLAAYPLIGAAMLLTIAAGQLLFGPDFEVRPHEELQTITEHAEFPVRLVVIVTAVVIVPVFEEILFRGIFQTLLRSAIGTYYSFRTGAWCSGKGIWPAIFFSSAVFSMFHYNPQHWPALFVLGVCLGYAYEKNGSLLRPIFIHSLFNTVSVVSTLSQ